MRRIALLAAYLIISQAAAMGQLLQPSPSPSASPVPIVVPGAGGTFQLIVYFFLIVGVLCGGLYFTRSGFGILGGRKVIGDKKLLISETRSLGNRQFLVVAEYENRKMLLGVCPGRIDYLSTLAGGGDETFSSVLTDKPE